MYAMDIFVFNNRVIISLHFLCFYYFVRYVKHFSGFGEFDYIFILFGS